jgi:membrane-associated protein
MNALKTMIDFILHADTYINQIVQNYGIWANAFLFFIIFMETGFVVTPFLPGDSLLFVVGALAAKGTFNLFLSFLLLLSAAIIGDAVNYFIGHKLGRKAFKTKWLNEDHLAYAESFYDKYGGRAVVLGRFVPIVRTFVPFVAGIGKMKYSDFLTYNIIGGAAWVSLFLFAGYFFGNIPAVKERFSLVVFAIIILSVVPAIYELLRGKIRAKKA